MKSCQQCQKNFEVPQDTQKFLKKMDFQFGEQKIILPEPINCPDCANQIRTAHRNERFLHKRTSDLSGNEIVSLYSREAPWGDSFKVYSPEEWHSDAWDPLEYRRDFDFDRPFFEQFAELQKDVPRMGLVTVDNENSPYVSGTAYSKNCHLINSSEHCQDCCYGKLLQTCKDCVDCTYLYDSELCYECFSVYNSYNCVNVSYSTNCSDCWFSENLTGCRNCFLCTNLTNKEYHFMNEPLEKEEYERRVKEFVGSRRNFEKAKEILKKMKKERIHKYANIVNCEESSGDFLKNCHSCVNCYDVNDSQDCRNVWVGVKVKDAYECSNLYFIPQLSYQILGAMESYHVAFSTYIFSSNDILYSHQIHGSENCFGSVGLKNKKYCVLNKQYSKEEYEELVPKIIEYMKKTGEWGQFFPAKYSPFPYNQSLANEYYPSQKEDILKKGWNWMGEVAEELSGSPLQEELPGHIDQVPDDITEQILTCEVSGKPYKVIKQELDFLRKVRIPIPTRSYEQRYSDRLSLRNTRKVWERNCDKCQKAIQTTYSPQGPEKVYCEQCYLAEVY
jgi:hypothetical protein